MVVVWLRHGINNKHVGHVQPRQNFTETFTEMETVVRLSYLLEM